MNIEQIAQEVANELFLGGKAVGHEPVEFLRRCLSKLAEQDVEPSCWMTPDGEGWRMRTAPPVNDVPLGWMAMYQETQLLAAQQRTAEACAKVCENITKEYDMDGVYADFFSNLIRNKWREYL